MRHSWIIWMCVALHLTWGGMVLADPSLGRILPLFIAEFLGPPKVAALVMIVCAVLAGIGLVIERKPSLRGLLLLHPQQFVLTASAISTVLFWGDGQYLFVQSPVGYYPYPLGKVDTVFFLAPVLLAAVFHTLAVIDGYSAGGWSAIRQILRVSSR